MILSPCVAICRQEDGVCIGCGRTKEEVTEWFDYTDNERKIIMERLEGEIRDLFD